MVLRVENRIVVMLANAGVNPTVYRTVSNTKNALQSMQKTMQSVRQAEKPLVQRYIWQGLKMANRFPLYRVLCVNEKSKTHRFAK